MVELGKGKMQTIARRLWSEGWQGRAGIVGIIALHFLLASSYSLALPLWEGHDEWSHYYYRRFLVENRRLPSAGETVIPGGSPHLPPMLDISKFHSPLYYVLAAAATFWIPEETDLELIVNPWHFPVAVHATEEVPYRGTALVIHVMRLVSVACGSATVALTYALVKTVFSGETVLAVAAAALLAFAPQFLYLTSIANNDATVTMWSALATLFLLRWVVVGRRWHDLGLFYLALLLAILTKVNAISLLPVAMIVLAGRELRRPSSFRVARAGAMALLPALMVILLAAVPPQLLKAPDLPRGVVNRLLTSSGDGFVSGPASVLTLLGRSAKHLFHTSWLAFGWGQVRADDRVYSLLAVVSGVAFIGYLLSLRPGWMPRARTGLFLVLGGSGVATVFAYSWPVVRLCYGRFLMPAFPAFAVVGAIGLRQMVPRRWSRGVLALASAGMLAFGLAALLLHLIPAFAPPRTYPVHSTPRIAHLLEVDYGGRLRLLGYDLEPRKISPGEVLVLRTYWSLTEEAKENYAVVVKMVTPKGLALADYHSLLGDAIYPTSRWRKGETVMLEYKIPVPDAADTPRVVGFMISVFSQLAGKVLEVLPARDGQGQGIGEAAHFGRIAIVASAKRPSHDVPDDERTYLLDGTVRLRGYSMDREARPGSQLSVVLCWEAVAASNQDLTAFVHVSDSREQIWAQHDSEPRDGEYPASFWEPGEVIEDHHILTLPKDTPPGTYQVFVGMYRPGPGERLSVRVEGGEALPDGRVPLGTALVIP